MTRAAPAPPPAPCSLPGDARGFTLAEVLVAAFVIGVVLAGVFPMIAVTTRGNTFDRNRVNAANAARRKVEALRAMPYETVAPGTTATTPQYLGYYETDLSKPGFTAGEDAYFVDTFALGNGVMATRRVLVQGIDDPLDGIGAADTDKLPGDYKLVTVTVEWKEAGRTRTLSQKTYFSGLAFEAIGAGGKAKDKKKGGKATGKGAMGKGVDAGTDPTDGGE